MSAFYLKHLRLEAVQFCPECASQGYTKDVAVQLRFLFIYLSQLIFWVAIYNGKINVKNQGFLILMQMA